MERHPLNIDLSRKDVFGDQVIVASFRLWGDAQLVAKAMSKVDPDNLYTVIDYRRCGGDRSKPGIVFEYSDGDCLAPEKV